MIKKLKYKNINIFNFKLKGNFLLLLVRQQVAILVPLLCANPCFWKVIQVNIFWLMVGYTGNEKATVRKVFLLAPTCFYNSQQWECSKLGCKRAAKISRQSNGKWVRDRYFSETDLVSCAKKKGFWEEKGKKRKWVQEETPDLT